MGRRRAHRTRDGPRADAAATEVIGTILLLAVAVGLAGAFVVFLFTVPPPTPEPHVDVGTYVLASDPDTVVVEHRGGPALPLRGLRMRLAVDGTDVEADVGERLAAADPAWSVLGADGAAKSATGNFVPGDRIRYTDAGVQGAALEVALVDAVNRASVLTALAVQEADPDPPAIASARTTSTTTIEVTFTEALYDVSVADLQVTTPARTIASVALLGNGSRAEVTVTVAFPADATPHVVSVASPAGTHDLAGNALAGGADVAATDGTAPTLSSISAGTPGNASATLTWTTDESGNTTVYFGPTPALGRVATGASGTAHSAALADLTENTLHFYRVATTDAGGSTATSGLFTFTTADDGSGSGGGGESTRYLEFAGVPATLDQGATSGTFTVTLKDAAGATVTSSSATVVLATNSSYGHFRDAAGTAIVETVTLASGTATLRYYDVRADGGTSVLTGYVADTIVAHARTQVVPHGFTPDGGATSGLTALRGYLLYPSAQKSSDTSVTMAVALANPTASSITVDSVSIAASPTMGTGSNSFFITPFAHLVTSDDAWEPCGLSGSNTNTLTCNPSGTFSLPAYGLTQWAFTFTTSGRASLDDTVLTATFTTSLGSVVAERIHVRHSPSGSAPAITFLPRNTAGNVDDTGGYGSTDMAAVNGGAAKTFHWEWDFEGVHDASDVLVTRIGIPAGWTGLSVAASQAVVTTDGAVVSVRDPGPGRPGWIEIRQTNLPSNGAERYFEFTATPPDITGIHEFDVEFGTLLGSSTVNDRLLAGAYAVPVRIQ